MTTETDDKPRKRYRRGSDLTRQTRIGARVAEPIALALERRAAQTGRTKNEIVETALARALGVEEAPETVVQVLLDGGAFRPDDEWQPAARRARVHAENCRRMYAAAAIVAQPKRPQG